MTDTYLGDEALFGAEVAITGDTTPSAMQPSTVQPSTVEVMPTSLTAPPTTLPWTDERVDLLRRLWIEGLSASRIAAELAGGVTRNAVIGKVHRLGLSGRIKAVAGDPAGRVRPGAVRPGPGMRQVTPQGLSGTTASDDADALQAGVSQAGMSQAGALQGGTSLAGTSLTGAAQAGPPPLPLIRSSGNTVLPLAENVTIMDLRESMCRWPVGDPSSAEFRYCGSKAPIGAGPYCAHHSRMAYQPVQDRNRRRSA